MNNVFIILAITFLSFYMIDYIIKKELDKSISLSNFVILNTVTDLNTTDLDKLTQELRSNLKRLDVNIDSILSNLSIDKKNEEYHCSYSLKLFYKQSNVSLIMN